MLRVGDSVGNYRVVRAIGRGAMGTVFEARHEIIGRRSAIKVPSEELLRDPEFGARFLNEARAANRVRHPGLLEIYEYGNLPDGAPYLVMELLEGESLDLRLALLGGRVPPAMALAVAGQLAGALAVAHAHGLIHRDLKPANVMLIPDPEFAGRERVKLLDFGIAKLAPTETTGADEIPATRAGVVLGTPAYMAPEQCASGALIDGQADVYALGVMLYEMLGGRRPFSAATPVEVMSMHLRDTPPSLAARVPETAREVVMLVNQMLAKHPAQRPTMLEVAGELRRLAGESEPRSVDELARPASATRSGPAPLPPTLALIADDCPFVVGPPITDPRRFFGRTRVLRRLASLWRRPPLQNGAVLGARRSGKTSLLLHLNSYVNQLVDASWPSPLRPRFCYVDFQDPRVGTREGLLKHLLKGLGLGDAALEGANPMERFIEEVATRLRSPSVVLLDELDVALSRYAELDDSFWEGLRALAGNQVEGNLAFVLSSHGPPGDAARQSRHGSPFFNIFGYTTTLGPFAEGEAEPLIDSSPLPLSPSDREFILERSGRWPILLQILCRECFLALQEGDGGDEWREEGLRQMEPFKHLLTG
jgi:serine/threonine protein kinase